MRPIVPKEVMEAFEDRRKPLVDRLNQLASPCATCSHEERRHISSYGGGCLDCPDFRDCAAFTAAPSPHNKATKALEGKQDE